MVIKESQWHFLAFERNFVNDSLLLKIGNGSDLAAVALSETDVDSLERLEFHAMVNEVSYYLDDFFGTLLICVLLLRVVPTSHLHLYRSSYVQRAMRECWAFLPCFVCPKKYIVRAQ